jgi:hypothetical protein
LEVDGRWFADKRPHRAALAANGLGFARD